MLKGKKPGKKPKDQFLTENFNTEKKLTAQEKRDLKEQEKLIAQAKKNARIAARKKKSGDDDSGIDFSDSDFQMLEDMRAVYQKLGGQRKLLAFIKKNDKAYELMVKELMKLESSMRQAEIAKNKGATVGNGNVFVVLKGLGDEEKALTIAMAADGENQIDMKSMLGILRPDTEPENNDPLPEEEVIIDPSKG